MGKKSKYEGGSVIVSFRLPALKLDEAKATIDAYLKRFESNPVPNDLLGRPVTPDEAFAREAKFPKWFSEALKNGKSEKVTGLMQVDPLSNEEMIAEAKLKFDQEFLSTADLRWYAPNDIVISGTPEQIESFKKAVEMEPEPGTGGFIPSIGSRLLDEVGVWHIPLDNKERKGPGAKKKSLPSEVYIKKLPPGNLDKFLDEPRPPVSNGTLFPCGCYINNEKLFVRRPGCKNSKANHKL